MLCWAFCGNFCCALWFDLKRPCFLLVFKVPALKTCSFSQAGDHLFTFSGVLKHCIRELDSACVFFFFLINPFLSRLETMAGRNKGSGGLFLGLLCKCNSAFPRRSWLDHFSVGYTWFWYLTSPIYWRGICHQIARRTCLLDGLHACWSWTEDQKPSSQLQVLHSHVWPQGTNITRHCPHSAWPH